MQRNKKMIYCYNDIQGYGRKLYDAVNANNGSANMIGMAAQVPNEPQSIVYINLDGTQAAQDVYYNLCQLDNVRIIPSHRVVEMSDNCMLQQSEISKWLPSGWIVDNLRDAVGTIQRISYPVCDLSNPKKRIRIENSDEAFRHIAGIFNSKSTAPKKIYLRTEIDSESALQKKVYFRTEIDSVDNEWFVFMLGKKYAFAARTYNNSFAMIDSVNEQYNELLKYVYAFMSDEDISWASVKVICGADKEMKYISVFVDNIYASFPFDWLQTGGMMFETDNGYDWKSTGKPALRIFDFAAKMINEGIL
jgi:hypothetical protein